MFASAVCDMIECEEGTVVGISCPAGIDFVITWDEVPWSSDDLGEHVLTISVANLPGDGYVVDCTAYVPEHSVGRWCVLEFHGLDPICEVAPVSVGHEITETVEDSEEDLVDVVGSSMGEG